MSYSLGEIESAAKRAARGAGYSWGMAEEAGKAARWLCANGLDGCGPLARLLDLTDGQPMANLSPESPGQEWTGVSGSMCPLMAGAALTDCVAMLNDSSLVMRNVLYPALILPFAAAAAQGMKRPITVIWSRQSATVDASGICLTGAVATLNDPLADHLRVSIGGAVGNPLPRATRATPDAADWVALDRFAHHTYAPASDASRLLGAGTALSDND